MNNEILEAANTEIIKLSTKGKIFLLPSFLLTLPFYLTTVLFGFFFYILFKILSFIGLIDALDYQSKIIQRTLKNRKLKK